MVKSNTRGVYQFIIFMTLGILAACYGHADQNPDLIGSGLKAKSLGNFH